MDPADIAQKICALVQSPGMRNTLVERGKKRLVSFGTARSRAERYLEICEQLLATHPAKG